MTLSWPTSPENRDRPLSGVKVLDVSRVLAAPLCSMLLGDLGADVVKVEPPYGDETRRWGSPVLDDTAAYYFVANRNKWDVMLDLTTDQGRGTLREFIAQADVVLHNYTGALAVKLGVDFETVRAINPEVIYLSVTGFGPEQPERRGFDLVAQALGGIMAVTGPIEGPASKVGLPISDIATGIFSALGVVAALYGRTSSNKGARIDVSLYDSTLALLTNQAMSFLTSGVENRRLGNDHPSVCPYGVYDTADGSIVIAAGTESQFGALCDVLGASQLVSDPRFAKNLDRLVNRDELRIELEAALSAHDATEWTVELDKAGVPNGQVQSIEQALTASDAKSVFEVTHPTYGPIRQVANPIRVNGEYMTPYLAPPSRNEHGDAILGSSEASA